MSVLKKSPLVVKTSSSGTHVAGILDMSLIDTKESVGEEHNILIIDDEAPFCDTIATDLSTETRKCLQAASAEEALQLLNDHRISVVLLDWRLNQPAGALGAPDFLKACRQMSPSTPIIVITGSDLTDVRTDAFLADADGFLQKPFSTVLLSAHIDRWLRRLESGTPKIAFNPQKILPMEEVKRRYAEDVLKHLDGNVRLAAAKLGIHRQTLSALLENESNMSIRNVE